MLLKEFTILAESNEIAEESLALAINEYKDTWATGYGYTKTQSVSPVSDNLYQYDIQVYGKLKSDNEFDSQQAIFEALVAGKKLQLGSSVYLHFKDGKLMWETGIEVDCKINTFFSPQDWVTYKGSN